MKTFPELFWDVSFAVWLKLNVFSKKLFQGGNPFCSIIKSQPERAGTMFPLKKAIISVQKFRKATISLLEVVLSRWWKLVLSLYLSLPSPPALPIRSGDTSACSWRKSSSMASLKVNLRKWAVFWSTYLMFFWHHLMLSIAGKQISPSYTSSSSLLAINRGLVVENLDRNFWSEKQTRVVCFVLFLFYF